MEPHSKKRKGKIIISLFYEMENKMKKTVSMFLVVAMLFALATSFSFAAASDPSQSVPAHITVAETAIDVTVPDKITMTAAANNPALDISDYTVKNNSALGTIKVESLKVTAETGWTLVADETDFAGMAANSQKFSFKHGSYDFATGATETLSSGNTAAPGATATFSFTGKTGVVTSKLEDIKVATVVVTLGYQ